MIIYVSMYFYTRTLHFQVQLGTQNVLVLESTRYTSTYIATENLRNFDYVKYALKIGLFDVPDYVYCIRTTISQLN